VVYALLATITCVCASTDFMFRASAAVIHVLSHANINHYGLRLRKGLEVTAVQWRHPNSSSALEECARSMTGWAQYTLDGPCLFQLR
jgi:hypothetical protein